MTEFALSTSGDFYSPEERDRLAELGFTFESYISKRPIPPYDQYERWIIKGNPTVEMASIDALIAFGEKWGALIINPYSEDANHIEIYDDYRE